ADPLADLDAALEQADARERALERRRIGGAEGRIRGPERLLVLRQRADGAGLRGRGAQDIALEALIGHGPNIAHARTGWWASRPRRRRSRFLSVAPVSVRTYRQPTNRVTHPTAFWRKGRPARSAANTNANRSRTSGVAFH